MKKNIIFEDIPFSNKFFWLGFISSCFANAYDEDSDLSICDILNEFTENEKLVEYWDNFTGYYDGVMEENDGYLNEPTTFKCTLSNMNILKIEFHPGDTVFYINDAQIGCTGPHFKLEVYPFSSIEKYAESNRQLFMLMLPLAKIQKSEREKALMVLTDILKEFIDNYDCNNLAVCIIKNFLRN